MPWNWELPDWPRFSYDSGRISSLERKFLLGVGSAFAYLKTIDEQEYKSFIVEILSLEGLESSRIEGEILDRESLQSSIKQHFGLKTVSKQEDNKESGMAELLCNVYESFDKPLTHEMLWQWHSMLFKDSSTITDWGKYRTHAEPMQIVSILSPLRFCEFRPAATLPNRSSSDAFPTGNDRPHSDRYASIGLCLALPKFAKPKRAQYNRYDSPKVFFEAPPSTTVFHEMTLFIEWFNSTNGSESILGRAAIAHVYFETIHPFEDGNGRIGRVIVEKILSQGVGRPTLIAVSKMLEKRKKEYYAALEKCNRTLEIDDWVEFFSSVILLAHEESITLLHFLIKKSKILNALSGRINLRQTKVLLRIFEEGPNGFKGGLSAENYIAITKTTRATATRDLTDLVEKGALVKTGELRHTRYRLNLLMQ